jgi:hypothetical protein
MNAENRAERSVLKPPDQTNDASYNALFHNRGNKFEEVAFEAGVALTTE